MKKTIISLVMIAGTLMTSAILIAAAVKETPVTTTIVTTQRRDVYKTIGLLGQLAYADEQIILSAVTGNIEKVYVSPGDRLADGSIVVSYDGLYLEEIAAFCTDHGAKVPAQVDDVVRETIEKTVQRTTQDCTVREVYIQQGTPVTAGMPIAKVSSTSQELRCLAAQVDAESIKPGMWAWIKHRGDEFGHAMVKSVEEYFSGTNIHTDQYMITLIPEQHIELEKETSLDVSIYVSGSSDVVSLPLEALTERDTVWWVNAEGRCTEIPADIVLCDETHAWVNLPEGIQVAVGEFTEGQRITGDTV